MDGDLEYLFQHLTISQIASSVHIFPLYQVGLSQVPACVCCLFSFHWAHMRRVWFHTSAPFFRWLVPLKLCLLQTGESLLAWHVPWASCWPSTGLAPVWQWRSVPSTMDRLTDACTDTCASMCLWDKWTGNTWDTITWISGEITSGIIFPIFTKIWNDTSIGLFLPGYSD